MCVCVCVYVGVCVCVCVRVCLCVARAGCSVGNRRFPEGHARGARLQVHKEVVLKTLELQRLMAEELEDYENIKVARTEVCACTCTRAGEPARAHVHTSADVGRAQELYEERL